MNWKNITIVGGGPAGMMAAISASGIGRNITLVEKNDSPGRKLLLSGNGRCNFTNDRELVLFLEAYGKHGSFLRDAFKNMFNRDLVGFFESRGLKCYSENDGRIFPETNRSSDVLKVLEDELASLNVNVIKCDGASSIAVREGRVSMVKLNSGKMFKADVVILATGGISYPSTGSSGDGFLMAETLGHTITPIRGGLVPLIIKEDYPASLMGLSLNGVKVNIVSPKLKFRSEKGDIIFTHDGLSGPLILSLSGMVSDILSQNAGPVTASIDLFPDIKIEDLIGKISRLIADTPSRTLKTRLKTILPERMASLLLKIAGLSGSETGSQIPKSQLNSLTSLCKKFVLTIEGTYPVEKAMITRGGVSLKEIDPRTMSSRIIQGLYFAGEILDIDGDTGGFNLQAAFSTGHLAGASASDFSGSSGTVSQIEPRPG